MRLEAIKSEGKPPETKVLSKAKHRERSGMSTWRNI